jgi:Rad3-related DNA helicase
MEGILHSLKSARSQQQEDSHRHLLALANNSINCYDEAGEEKRSITRVESLVTFCHLLRHFASLREARQRNKKTDDAHADVSASTASATATWLYELCTDKVSSPMPPLQFSLAILSAITSPDGDESKMQSSLFELFGEGEQNIEALFEVMGRTVDIVKFVTPDMLHAVAKSKGENDTSASAAAGAAAVTMASSSTPSMMAATTDHENKLQQLRSEAYAAVDVASALRPEQNNNDTLQNNNISRGTHSVTRTSDKEAEKTYKRAMKQAATAIKKARDAGALTESDELILQLNPANNNTAALMEQMMLRNEEAMLYSSNGDHVRGLDGMTPQQIEYMKRSLLPEGTREYNDSHNRGLPRGSIREIKEGYEKVIIPAPIIDKSTARLRINLDEVMGSESDERMAFEGCDTLNPMQSAVFETAYNTRENLLICAPTGAGKTNVAMLAVVSHLRDVGLIGSAYHDDDHFYDNGPVSTGKKIVYIAPMKALAQEVVEKFSSKLKCLGIIVRELTGDMQLSRAEAEAAHILVTTPEIARFYVWIIDH